MGRTSNFSKLENVLRPPLEPVHSCVNDCWSTALVFDSAAQARPQFRRCTSVRKFVAAPSGVSAFAGPLKPGITVPVATPPLAWPTPKTARTISPAVTATRMIGRIIFISFLRRRSVLPQEPQSAPARGVPRATTIRGKSQGNLHQSAPCPKATLPTGEGQRRIQSCELAARRLLTRQSFPLSHKFPFFSLPQLP